MDTNKHEVWEKIIEFDWTFNYDHNDTHNANVMNTKHTYMAVNSD